MKQLSGSAAVQGCPESCGRRQRGHHGAPRPRRRVEDTDPRYKGRWAWGFVSRGRWAKLEGRGRGFSASLAWPRNARSNSRAPPELALRGRPGSCFTGATTKETGAPQTDKLESRDRGQLEATPGRGTCHVAPGLNESSRTRVPVPLRLSLPLTHWPQGHPASGSGGRLWPAGEHAWTRHEAWSSTEVP